MRPWSLLTILNFSKRRPTDTTNGISIQRNFNVSSPSSHRDKNTFMKAIDSIKKASTEKVRVKGSSKP